MPTEDNLRGGVAGPTARPVSEPALLMIADISGYTRYMTANAKTLSHSHTIITELVEAILREIELPLEVAKLEGDAVFLFCRQRPGASGWNETRRIVGAKLLSIFRKFAAKVLELSESTTCNCSACAHIEKLRLKIVVHSGEAIFHRVANFQELAGVDVIAVHRLLKNSVEADQYLLLTEAAHRDLEFPETLAFFPSSETYADIGRINTLVHLTGGANARVAMPTDAPARNEVPQAPRSAGSAEAGPPSFADAWSLWLKLWFAPLRPEPPRLRGSSRPNENSVAPARRGGFAFITLLLTPFMLPVGAMLVAWHVSRAFARHAASHPADCGCGAHHH